jgi:hypothetical protein
MLKVFFFSLFIPVYVTVCGQQFQSFQDPASKKYGLKDASGKIIVAPKYDTIKAFKDDVAVAGKKVTWTDYKYGLINKAGKEIIPLIHEIVYTDAGIVVVQADDKYGFMDKTGKKLSPLKYNNVWEFSDGIAGVEIYDRDKGEGKWGFVDNTGKVVIPVKYDRVLSNKKGVIVESEGKYFAVAKSGKEIPLNYERIGYAAYGLLLVKANNKYGFINTKGELVIPLKYDNAWDFSEWQRTGFLSCVRLGNKSGFIDTSGKEVIPLQYDMVGLFREGLAKVTMNPVPAVDSKNGYIDSAGNLVIPMHYYSAGNFSEGMAAVSKKTGGRNFIYGYIEPSGKEVIPFSFESAEEFSEGLAAVKKNGKYGFIDKQGKEVISFKYESVISGFSNKRAKVVLNGKNITIDKTGKEN